MDVRHCCAASREGCSWYAQAGLLDLSMQIHSDKCLIVLCFSGGWLFGMPYSKHALPCWWRWQVPLTLLLQVALFPNAST